MIVGTAGHIDHGKTSLVRALTGVDADRLKEEKARGITIDLGFAYMEAGDDTVIGFVDVPGHEKLIHNMLAGATGIDYALLVVAADDGIMPQTREHLAILDLLGIERGLVAITKADLIDHDRLPGLRNDIANALLGTALEGADIIKVSSVTGEGIGELRQRLIAEGSRTAAAPPEAPFRLAVDRSFTLKGAGTVVTGTVISGQVRVGDHMVVSPSGLKVRIRGLHAQNRKADLARVGDRCALNLTGDGVSKDAIARGDMVVEPGLHAPAERIDARIRVLASELRPVTQWMPARLHHATSDVAARVVLLSDQPIAPGEEAYVQLVMERPIAAASGDRFVLRDTTAQRTLAGGTLLDLRAPARRRRSPERLALLEAHGLTDDRAALEALLSQPPLFVDPVAFARDRAMTPQRFAEIAGELGLVRIDSQSLSLVLSPATWLRLKRALLAALEEFHEKNPDLAGIGMERLRLQLQPRLPAPAFAALLQALTRDGVTALDGAWVKLPGHVVRLSAKDETLWARMEPLLTGEARFRPPRVRDIAHLLDENEVDIRRLFKMLSRMGRVDEIAQDHFFLRDALAEIVDISRDIAETSEDRQLTAAQLRDRLDCGRKVAIFILEFLDRHGVTIRRGDLRRINKHRLDLFSGKTKEAMVEAIAGSGGDASPVGRPDFKSGRGREPVLGGFDSHSLPPNH